MASSLDKTTHVLNRLGFGPSVGDRQQVKRDGIETYIQKQLNPQQLSEPAELTNRLKAFPELALSAVELFDQYVPPREASSDQHKQARQHYARVIKEAEKGRLLRALGSQRQLQEVMVDFWFNHFNVFAEKGLTKVWTGAYEQEAIRPHVLGKFGTLVRATAQHPAMLFYLDNWQNTDPNGTQARGVFKGINENYARELMELHTLGVEGNYSQQDVESLAKALTGWSSVHPAQPDAVNDGGFVFVAGRHDASAKVLLGEAIAPGGIEQGEAALDLLAKHPATARHISYKLAQYFVADTPPAPLVKRLSEVFLASDGNIKSVLTALFKSDAFWAHSHYQNKFKTPYQYSVSLVRAVGMTSLPDEKLQWMAGELGQLGMPLYRCRTPKGYAQTEGAWLNPDAMIRRVNFAIATMNLPDKDKISRQQLTEQTFETLRQDLSTNTQAVIKDAPVYLRPALLLGSPEMMYR